MGDYKITLNPYHVYNEMERSSGVPFDAKPEELKITAPIWNKFADVVGAGHIKRFIKFDNAIEVIEKQLNKASVAKQDKVADLFGFHKVTQEEVKEYDEKAMSFLRELAADPSQIIFTKKKDKNPFANGGYVLEAKLPDGRGVKFDVDKSGKLCGSVRVNFDTSPNGVNFQDLPIDYDDVSYTINSSLFSYITKDGKDGDEPNTNSYAYDVSGANDAEIKKLSQKIISAYKNN